MSRPIKFRLKPNSRKLKNLPGRCFVAGIDVGGAKKGFHLAVLDPVSESFSGIYHLLTPKSVCEVIKDFSGRCLAIAIDCPPCSFRPHKQTRLAERELHQAGFRIQWVPEKGGKPQEWMENGEKLWRSLKKTSQAFLFSKHSQQLPATLSLKRGLHSH